MLLLPDGLWGAGDTLLRLIVAPMSRFYRRRTVAAVRWPAGGERLNFEVRAGEVLGLIGPNGAGKSTDVQRDQRLYRPTSGGSRFAARISPVCRRPASAGLDWCGRSSMAACCAT